MCASCRWRLGRSPAHRPDRHRMRLFTHNFLQCHVKGCTTNNFPLPLSEVELESRESEYNEQFMRNYLCKLDWPALLQTITSLNLKSLDDTKLPEEMPEEVDETLLRSLHHVLFETAVKNGRMTCQGCGHIYLINDGIPNMLLSEDEV